MSQIPLSISYEVVGASWNEGYVLGWTLTNTSTSPTTSWSFTFTLPVGQTTKTPYNAVLSSSVINADGSRTYTFANPTWIGGGVIAAGASNNTPGTVVTSPNLNALPSTTLTNLSATGTIGESLPIPTAPVLNAIQMNSNGGYTVSWNSVPNASSYTLDSSTSSTFATFSATNTGTSTSITFPSTTSGNYYYRASATDASGTSTYSNVQTITIPPAVTPRAPVLSAISNTSESNNFVVNWSNVGAQGYMLQMSTTSTFQNPTTLYNGSATSFQVNGQSEGTFYFRVNAFNQSLQSPFSNTVSTTVKQQTTSSATVEGYWESWDSTVSISSIVNMAETIIDVAFVTFQEGSNNEFTIIGLDCTQSQLTQMVIQAHAMSKKVKVSCGGATYGFSGFLTSTAAAQGMATAIAAYVQSNNLDGVDYDIEDYPSASLQIALIQATRNLLPDSLISYTPKTPASTTEPYKDVIVGAYSYLSTIAIMAYDAYPGYNFEQDVQALIALGVPANKIVVGLMPGADDEENITSLAAIQSACNYIIQNKLAGIMFWSLNRDYSNSTGLGMDAATNAAAAIL